jgi:hypothetical protein
VDADGIAERRAVLLQLLFLDTPRVMRILAENTEIVKVFF